MEGSRHERALLVAVAYFIGGLTVFIGYALPSGNFSLPVIDGEAAVVRAVPDSQVARENSSVAYREGLLEVEALGGTRVLSFNPEVTGDVVSPEFVEQGMHVGTLNYVASPENDYVFFCEQKEISAETCSPFIYDVLADMIFPVRKDGTRVDLLVSAASEVSWNKAGLTIGGISPTDSAKPWLLGN